MGAIIKGNARQTSSAQSVGEGADVYLRLLRNGDIGVADYLMCELLAGNVKVANGGGVASTPITFAGAYDADGPDFALNVPSGVGVMVIRAEVVVDALTDDEDIEIIFMTSNTAHTGTTGTLVTVKNKMNNKATGSGCTCYVALDAAGGTDVSGGSNAYTFWHDRLELGAAPAAAQSEEGQRTRLDWVAPRDGLPAVVIGAGSVVGHVCKTTAGTGFITVEWVEFSDSSSLT